MTKWALAFILVMFATGDGFPIYFSERPYWTLEQLDEALANGEISQEYYDEFVDAFAGYPAVEPTSEDLRPNVAVLNGSQAIQRWHYSSIFRQQLEPDFGATRYDQISCGRRGFTSSIAFEKLSQKACLVRSIAFSIWRSSWHLNIGNLSFPYANGLTIGRSALHKELHNDGDFAASLLYPTRNRKNGVEFEREVGNFAASIYLSRLQGNRYYVQSYGGDFRRHQTAADFGLLALRQQSGERGGRLHTINYLAPHTRIGNPNRRLLAESSFQIRGASAHSLRGELHSDHLRQSYEFFSYGSRYYNLESGGYAYSDYDDVALDDVGLEYRDKRPGRIGIAIDQSLSVGAESISGQIVRWDDRSDGRRCVATRATFLHQGRESVLRVQAIYQDLDIENGRDIRKLIAISTELRLAESFTYENHHKIERRILNESKKLPFRSRHDFSWRFDRRFKGLWMVNFYDSDLNSDSNSQVNLALGLEIISSRDFTFSARFQSRYRFAVERLDNWELRINLAARL